VRAQVLDQAAEIRLLKRGCGRIIEKRTIMKKATAALIGKVLRSNFPRGHFARESQ